VAGKACVIIDDTISTAGTMAQAVGALLDRGARADIAVAATHGLFVDGARERLERCRSARSSSPTRSSAARAAGTSCAWFPARRCSVRP